MKAVILCTQLEGGGAQRASYKLSNEFNKRDIECENWFLYKKRDNYSGSGITKVCLERPVKSMFDYLKIMIRYYKYLKEFKPDVVITFTHYANVLGLSIAWLAGVRIRIASHRNPSWGDMSKLLIMVDNLFSQYVYTAITAVSASTKITFKYYWPGIYEKLTVINNGFDFPTVTATKTESRELFNLPADAKIIGTIGRLAKQKNHQLLLNAIAFLDDVYLVIAGDGELKEELKSWAKQLGVEKRIFFLGEISYQKIPEFLLAIDVFVMPSLFEGLSNALVEAMALGVPIIASDIDAQRDVLISLDGTAHGILLPVNNVAAWTLQISSLLNNNDQMEKYAALSKHRASEFSLKKMADGFVQVINRHGEQVFYNPKKTTDSRFKRLIRPLPFILAVTLLFSSFKADKYNTPKKMAPFAITKSRSKALRADRKIVVSDSDDFPANPVEKPGWYITADDEFNGPDLNEQLWIPYYLRQRTSDAVAKANYVFKDGALILKIDEKGNKVSAIQTLEKHNLHKPGKRTDFPNRSLFVQKYGYFEIRAKTQAGSGYNSAFWLVGVQNDTTQNAEIDVIEQPGNAGIKTYQTNLHPWSDNSLIPHDVGKTGWAQRFTSGRDLTNTYNIYALEWNVNELKFFFNNKLVRTIPTSPAYAMGVILSFYEAQGNAWYGNVINARQSYPKRFVIDYFRAYQRKPR